MSQFNLGIFQSISTRFKTQVQDVLEGTHSGQIEYVYDNDPKGNPNPPVSTAASGVKYWMRVCIMPGKAEQVSLGTPTQNRFRQPGILQVMIFVPTDNGDKTALEFADVISNAFRSITTGGVIYKSPYPDVKGTVGSWWRIDVICPWHADYFG